MSDMSEQYPATETALGIGATTLHYATWGQRTTPERAVLLVHGLTASHKEFAALGPALAAAGCYAIAPDLRGRGLSAKPAHGYGVPLHAHDLLTLADALGLQQVNVVGHSLGAVIAMYMAALYPARTARIVMIDAGGKIPEDTAQAIAASVNRLGMVYPSLDAYLATMRAIPFFEWGPLWEEYFRYDALVAADGTVTSRVPKAAIEEESFALGALRSEALPAFVRCPTLVLRATVGLLGPDRGLILPAEEAERLRAVIADCQVVEVPGTNHYTIVHDEQLLQATARFLAG
jgi:pimeloyl-ACP methyl ester carboxylesterase